MSKDDFRTSDCGMSERPKMTRIRMVPFRLCVQMSTKPQLEIFVDVFDLNTSKDTQTQLKLYHVKGHSNTTSRKESQVKSN